MLKPCDLDPKAVRRQADRAARHASPPDFIARRIEAGMLERLDLVRLQPARVLDVGSGRGQGTAALATRYPEALCVGVDLSVPALKHGLAATEAASAASGWLRRTVAAIRAAGGASHAPPSVPRWLGADTLRLPLRSASVDLIWSNLAWHQFPDPLAVIAEWHRVIRPGGLLMFSAFGVDTLRDLPGGGAGMPRFPDMHDVGDALVHAGFAEPVMDVERLRLGYRQPADLLSELRGALGGNALRDRRRGLLGRGVLREIHQALIDRRGSDELIPVELEIIHGHAWCPERKRLPDGLAPIEFRPRR